jgi:putative flavoprotein involved in K+ transport
MGRTRQPYVVVVGGGQGGIALGARLRQLGVPHVVLDRHERPGDQWRKRYKSLCLHDPVWYDHLPYLPFPPNWPVFSPKDKIADWLEMYVRVMEVDYWGSTSCRSARWDESTQEWEVVVERGGEELVLRPRQLVLATGMSGKPNLPGLPGDGPLPRGRAPLLAAPRAGGVPGQARRRRRLQQLRPRHLRGAVGGRRGGDDGAALLHPHREVRLPDGDRARRAVHEQAVGNGITTEKADMVFASLPYRIMHEFQIPLYDQMRERDRDFYDRLEKAGFWLDWGDDGSGLFMKYLRRGSGLLHRRGCLRAGGRRLDPARARLGARADRGRGRARGRHRAAGGPSSSTPPATAR